MPHAPLPDFVFDMSMLPASLQTMSSGASLWMALFAAAAMGLALQRGSTCMVAAIDELVHRRRGTRLLALLEAALWVWVGLLVAVALGAEPALPPMPKSGAPAIFGAALLGLGAFINGACVFGTVARLGAGEWAYLATPAGFYLGCLTVPASMAPAAFVPTAPAAGNASSSWPSWLVGLLVALAVVRLSWVFVLDWVKDSPQGAWSPQSATTVVGLAFLGLLLLVGAWSYTDVLTELAGQSAPTVADNFDVRGLLALALIGGAWVGGWAGGLWQWRRPAVRTVARCLVGGWLLGWGSVLVPGSNDSLVLLGMPLLWPHAWLSFSVMSVVIGLALWAAARPLTRAWSTRLRVLRKFTKS